LAERFLPNRAKATGSHRFELGGVRGPRSRSLARSAGGSYPSPIIDYAIFEESAPVATDPSKVAASILTTPDETDTRMEVPAEDALRLQRPLADVTLVIVARGEKKDEGGLAA
jgi:hypothetical protein